MSTETLILEDGGTFTPSDHSVVECEVHNVKTTYGALDPMQRLALSEGLDTKEGMPCLLAPRTPG
ncbi:MAG: hypothetical protein RB191_02260 [Terriglobia bacterium]|nr:hypothetical protein [Terriglobia bacterium]